MTGADGPSDRDGYAREALDRAPATGAGAARRVNEFGQPIGANVPGWSARAWPSREPMRGRYVELAPPDLDRHARDLHAAYAEDRGGLWTYMPVGPFATEDAFRTWLSARCGGDDPLFHVVLDRRDGKAVGLASYLRIAPEAGTIEIGHIAFSPRLQRTPLATEAIFLMVGRVFDELGYRRCEWKCDALNAPSRRAAERFGFAYDGLFRQALVYKGRNRDTAWYSLLDRDWPATARAFERWLEPSNLDADGAQSSRLADLIVAERDGRS